MDFNFLNLANDYTFLAELNFLIISSMNFTPHSVSGKSIESGIFTNDIDTIEKADLFFYEILEG